MTREDCMNLLLEAISHQTSSQGRMINELGIKDMYINSLEQRIKELEQQLEPKSCIDCTESRQLTMAHCSCSIFGTVKNNHYCAYYEPKDEE